MHSGMNFKTVLGDIAFDKKGDVTRADYVVYVWKKGPDGRIRLLSELDSSERRVMLSRVALQALRRKRLPSSQNADVLAERAGEEARCRSAPASTPIGLLDSSARNGA